MQSISAWTVSRLQMTTFRLDADISGFPLDYIVFDQIKLFYLSGDFSNSFVIYLLMRIVTNISLSLSLSFTHSHAIFICLPMRQIHSRVAKTTYLIWNYLPTSYFANKLIY
jgi:hypothetical protein